MHADRPRMVIVGEPATLCYRGKRANSKAERHYFLIKMKADNNKAVPRFPGIGYCRTAQEAAAQPTDLSDRGDLHTRNCRSVELQ
jgi:hypothetical protein